MTKSETSEQEGFKFLFAGRCSASGIHGATRQVWWTTQISALTISRWRRCWCDASTRLVCARPAPPSSRSASPRSPASAAARWLTSCKAARPKVTTATAPRPAVRSCSVATSPAARTSPSAADPSAGDGVPRAKAMAWVHDPGVGVGRAPLGTRASESGAGGRYLSWGSRNCLPER